MRASQAPQPLPLPPPPLHLPSPPAAPRRGRHRASSPSSPSSASSFHSCPSPSPATSPRASLVPFSWECHPGVPKTSLRGGSPTGAPLPLPPPLRPAPRRRRRHHANVTDVAAASPIPTTNSSDPFVAAFAECTREEGDEGTNHGADVSVADRLWLARTKPTPSSVRAERRWWLAGAGFLDLHGCKSSVAVADDAFLARRPVVPHGRRPSRR